MKRLLLFLFCICSIFSFSQERIKGKIIDQETNEALPFTFLIKKSTNSGAITNTDGYFEMVCQPSDTITISFIGYETSIVPITYFIEKSEFYMKPKTNMLSSVSVFGKVDIDNYLSVLKKAKKKLLASNPYQSKTYFTLESNYNSHPIELLECYYNATLNNQGIENLALKNGRIGLAELGTSYFVSLHTTYVMERFNLLYKNNTEFPSNPLHFSNRKIRKRYDVKLVGLNDDIFVLEFIPNQNKSSLFSTKIWVDRKVQHIVKIEVWRNNLKMHPFVEIDAGHKMDSLNFRLTYSFDNSDRQLLNKIEFSYDFDYDNKVTKRRIFSEGIFLFYEKDSQFNLPYNSLEEFSLSDYDKIVSQPYNPQFWKFNEVLSPSNKVKETRQFFEENGLLLNFSKLESLSPIFKNRIVPWDTTRILLSDLNGEINYEMNDRRLKSNAKAMIRAELYEFVYGIYLDRNEIEDSIFFTSSTLIDTQKSFYFLSQNKFTDCLINLVFDLVEIERRKMISNLELSHWSLNEVDSIYTETSRSAKLKVDQFIKTTEHGTLEDEIMDYVTEIDSILTIDNTGLIRIFERDYNDSLRLYYIAEIYSIGTALIELGKYEVALNVLKVGENFGNDYPWLYYNLGVCYYQLNEVELACQNFKVAEQSGELVEDLFKELCSVSKKQK
ncbi:MAG: carboxypeptidase-like regulatory domain-containing protein [Crocinitomicaceae bacterium]